MKKIINGKLYDTNTAKELGMGGASCSARDFRYYVETLYRKRTGEFFLHGKGGPASKYADRVGDMMTGGEKIIPIDLKQAMAWVEENLRAEEYQEIFGAPDGGEEEHLHVALDASLMTALRVRAAEQGMSVTATLEEILRDALKN